MRSTPAPHQPGATHPSRARPRNASATTDSRSNGRPPQHCKRHRCPRQRQRQPRTPPRPRPAPPSGRGHRRREPTAAVGLRPRRAAGSLAGKVGTTAVRIRRHYLPRPRTVIAHPSISSCTRVVCCPLNSTLGTRPKSAADHWRSLRYPSRLSLAWVPGRPITPPGSSVERFALCKAGGATRSSRFTWGPLHVSSCRHPARGL